MSEREMKVMVVMVVSRKARWDACVKMASEGYIVVLARWVVVWGWG